MEKQIKKRAGKRKYWLVGGAVVLVIAVLLGVVAHYLDSWAAAKLKKQVSTKSGGLYALQLGAVDISLLAGSAALDRLELTPDSAVWHQLQKKNPAKAPASISRLKAERVTVQGISFVKLLMGGPLGVHTVELQKPELWVRQMKKDTASKPLHQKLGPQFQQMTIQEIKVSEGVFHLFSEKQPQNSLLSLQDIELRAHGTRLDSTSYHDNARAFYSEYVTFSAKGGTFNLPGGDYRVKGGTISFSTQDRKAGLQNVCLIPLRSAAEMSSRAGEAVTRFRVQVPEVRMRKLDFANLFRHSNLYMETLQVLKPTVQTFKDGKNFPTKGQGYLPHDLVQQLPFGLNVRTAEVKDLYVRYEELSEKAFRTGYVTGSDIDFTITNLTNDQDLISHKTPAILKAKGFIMGKALLQATVRLPLLDPNGYHSIEGTIGRGNPAILNPVIEPSMFVRVKSGYVQRGAFRVELNKTSAKGFLQLQYDDFKVDLLNKSPERKQSLGRKLKSVLADKLVLKSDSEQNGKAPRQGSIQVQRRTERSFLTYWKDCLANGVLSVIGAPM
ncbi:hypothetical protein [Rufibacter psychrotolerans]|uniref:hypothetical protein n=1 Tax=Rufibacter psychrotolerans TaxID=2812556 RepID=UPI001966FF44|nr:hypothetical protein [Rufibacter sp. SYSU D00308]